MRPFCFAKLTLLLALFLPLGPTADAENWPHWRGPHIDGTSTATGLPSAWSADGETTENVRWRVDLPGSSASTPVIWGDTIYLTSAREQDDALLLLAIGTDGETRWEKRVDDGALEVWEQFAHETNATSPSPVTDGEHVFALFATGKLHAFTVSGEKAWEVDLTERYGELSLYFGLSTSPLLHEGRLYLQLLNTNAQWVVALDAKTGREVWKHERATDARQECLHSYASVIPYPAAGAKAKSLLVHGADYTTAHDLETGTETWRFGTLNPEEGYNPSFRLVATPVVGDDGLVIVPTAKRGPVFGLRPGESRGAIAPSAAAVDWTLERGTPDVPSPIVADGLVYLVDENGRLTVLDAESGETIYAERVHQGTHRGSPVLADGKLYVPATDGTVSVLRAGRTFEILAKNEVGGRLAASPAIAGDTIYLRTSDALWAVATDPEPAEPAPSDEADTQTDAGD